MGTNLTLFQFESNPVRVVVVNGETMFVAKDTAAALGYKDTVNAVKTHCDDAKSLKDIGVALHHPEQNQGLSDLDPQTKVIPESDVYALTFGSKLPSAKKFKAWVLKDVLPQIRKTGKYAQQLTPAEQLLENAKLLVEQERRLAVVEAEQAALKEDVSETKAKISSIMEGDDFITVKAYAKVNRKVADRNSLNRIGRRASSMCKAIGVSPGKVRDEVWGLVNSYPEDVVASAFAEYETKH